MPKNEIFTSSVAYLGMLQMELGTSSLSSKKIQHFSTWQLLWFSMQQVCSMFRSHSLTQNGKKPQIEGCDFLSLVYDITLTSTTFRANSIRLVSLASQWIRQRRLHCMLSFILHTLATKHLTWPAMEALVYYLENI